MGRRGPKPQVRWWAKDGGGFYYHGRLLVRCDTDDGPAGPNFLAALAERTKIDRQEHGKGTDGYLVSALLNAYRQFLLDSDRRGSLNNVTYFLKPFADLYGDLPVADLRGHQVREWLAKASTWGGSSKRLAVKMLSAALNWGVKDGLIVSNPLKGRMPMPKDTPRGRESRLAPEFIELLVENADPAFRMLLLLWRDTGARPEEIEQAEAFNYRSGRIIYQWNAREGYIHKQAKRGQQKDRVIYLTPELRAIVEQQIARHPKGKLFRTPRGRPWTKQNRIENWNALLARKPVAEYIVKQGLKRKHLVPYALRHSWASDFLDSGRSIKICAELMGTSVAMLEKVYGHHDDERLGDFYMDFMQAKPVTLAVN